MGTESEKLELALGLTIPPSHEEDPDLESYGKAKLLTAAEHLASRRHYENPEIVKTCLWFFSAILIQILAIAAFVFAILYFTNN